MPVFSLYMRANGTEAIRYRKREIVKRCKGRLYLLQHAHLRPAYLFMQLLWQEACGAQSQNAYIRYQSVQIRFWVSARQTVVPIPTWESTWIASPQDSANCAIPFAMPGSFSTKNILYMAILPFWYIE